MPSTKSARVDLRTLHHFVPWVLSMALQTCNGPWPRESIRPCRCFGSRLAKSRTSWHSSRRCADSPLQQSLSSSRPSNRRTKRSQVACGKLRRLDRVSNFIQTRLVGGPSLRRSRRLHSMPCSGGNPAAYASPVRSFCKREDSMGSFLSRSAHQALSKFALGRTYLVH